MALFFDIFFLIDIIGKLVHHWIFFLITSSLTQIMPIVYSFDYVSLVTRKKVPHLTKNVTHQKRDFSNVLEFVIFRFADWSNILLWDFRENRKSTCKNDDLKQRAVKKEWKLCHSMRLCRHRQPMSKLIMARMRWRLWTRFARIMDSIENTSNARGPKLKSSKCSLWASKTWTH